MPFNPEKSIILLIGPKGTGKSYIGNKLSELFDAHFLRIEGIWQKIKAEHINVASPEYIGEGIKRSLIAISDELSIHDVIIIESTGAFQGFPSYLRSLQSMAKVYLVKIQTPIEKCLPRIHARDQSLHVPVSDSMIENINMNAEMLELDWDIIIVNEPFVSEDKLKDLFIKRLRPRTQKQEHNYQDHKP